MEGWVCSHGLLDQGKLPERKGKQGQVACRRGQQLSIIPLAQRWNPWPQLWPDTSEGGRKRGQASPPLLSPPLPLATQVSNAPVLAKGQRFQCKRGSSLLLWIRPWWTAAESAGGSIDTEERCWNCRCVRFAYLPKLKPRWIWAMWSCFLGLRV